MLSKASAHALPAQGDVQDLAHGELVEHLIRRGLAVHLRDPVANEDRRARILLIVALHPALRTSKRSSN